MCDNDTTSIPGYTPRSAENEQWRYAVHLALIRSGFEQEAMAFLDCGNPETIHAVKVCPADPEHYAKACLSTCHIRICPECARRDAARLIARYKSHVEQVVKDGPGHYRLRHITLTTQYDIYSPTAKRDLRKAKRQVNLLFDTLLGKRWHKRGQGILAGAEYGPRGKLLHFHVLHYGPKIDYKVLSDVWEQISGFPVTWVTQVSVDEGLREIIKYVSKLSQLLPSEAVTLLTIIKGTRRVWSRGIFYGFKLIAPPHACPTCGALIEKVSFYTYVRRVERLNLIRGNNSSGRKPPRWAQLSLWGAT